MYRLTRTDISQVRWLLPRTLSAAQHPHTDGSAAAMALPPEPVQYNQSATGAADLYPSPLFHSVQYWYSNGDATLCTYQCEQSILFISRFIYVYTHRYSKLLTLHLLFTLELEGSLKASFGDPSILTFREEGGRKAPCSRGGIALCSFCPCNTAWTPPAVSEACKV